MMALLSFEKSVVNWPKLEERKAIALHIDEKTGFKNCIGFIDGTLIPLESKPSKNGKDCFSRKSFYGLSALVTCDDQRKIRFTHCGHCASAHDSRVLNALKLGKPAALLEGNKGLIMWQSLINFFYQQVVWLTIDWFTWLIKWLINWLVGWLTIDFLCCDSIFRFNNLLAMSRIRAEYVIGMLNGRFQSLRGLCIRINEKQDHAHAVLWFRVYCVLHNLLTSDRYDENWSRPEDIIAPSAETESRSLAMEHPDDGKKRREEVKRILLLANPWLIDRKKMSLYSTEVNCSLICFFICSISQTIHPIKLTRA